MPRQVGDLAERAPFPQRSVQGLVSGEYLATLKPSEKKPSFRPYVLLAQLEFNRGLFRF